jgi:hypothetical protein
MQGIRKRHVAVGLSNSRLSFPRALRGGDRHDVGRIERGRGLELHEQPSTERRTGGHLLGHEGELPPSSCGRGMPFSVNWLNH